MALLELEGEGETHIVGRDHDGRYGGRSSPVWQCTWEKVMGQELRKLSEQDILEKIKRLGPQQVAEVVDFIEFLAERRHRESPLVRFLNETSESRVGLEEVRRRLAKIPGKMSDMVRELRDERG
ncbi:MAG: hypothetical protein HYY20_11650 [Candidatus Tectomicrobia bacterium]|uniref:DUF2281 domain-containing protein n=1 Tax=Tectimicrobiota bacterium TaxID=2528274 RepID=A0A932G1R1_UNCTE|nr:hypothetical protein [Candidatus Tectomicrobia bacterium]